MAMTLTSRKTARQKLKALLAEITAFAETYDHETKAFGGRTPVAMVHSDGTKIEFSPYANELHRFIVTILWKRSDGDATEDYLDDLGKTVREKLLDNDTVAGVWWDLKLEDDFSALDYPMIDNVQYRRERIGVLVHVVGS